MYETSGALTGSNLFPLGPNSRLQALFDCHLMSNPIEFGPVREIDPNINDHGALGIVQ